MLNFSFNPGATAANTPISITSLLSTNNNLNLNSNEIMVLIPGVYEIVGEATVTSIAADDYGLGIYVNNELQGSTSVNVATGASETSTVPIYSIIEVIRSLESGYATVTFLPVGTPTIVGGTASIKKIS